MKKFLSLLLLLPLLCLAPLNAQQEPASGADGSDVDAPDRWPTQVPVPRNTRLRELTKKKSDTFIYETNNYRFEANAELHEDAQKAVGRLFECAYAANKAVAKVLPIPRAKGNRPAKDKLMARLLKTKADYIAAGGSEGSAGVFMYRATVGGGKRKEGDLREDRVMVPFASLGLNEEGEVTSKNVDSHVLVHELTHQCTALNLLPVWANEGLAEYVGYVPYDGEVLDFDKCFDAIKTCAQKRGALNYPFTFADFLCMPKEEMYSYMSEGIDTYLLSALCITYYVHLEGRSGVRCLQGYMRDMLRGADAKKSIKRLRGRYRNDEALQKGFIDAWEAHGIPIKFGK